MLEPRRSPTDLIERRWMSALLAATLALAGCSGGTADPALAEDEDPYRFVALSVGTASDGAFGQSWSEAVARTTAETGAEGDWVGSIDTPDQMVSQASSYADAGYDLVILAHGAMVPVGLELADRYPDTQFCVTPIPSPPAEDRPQNLCIFDVEQQVGAFRAGVLAGLVTESNVVASNQSWDIPAITRQTEAFELGARCVNSAVEHLNVITNNDSDPATSLTASQNQMRRGADVLMGATGTAMTGIFEAAKEQAGTYVIGQYVDAAPVAPEVVLASNIVNFQDVLPILVERAMTEGLPPSWFEAYGLQAPVPVGYLNYNEDLMAELDPEVRRANEAAQTALDDGLIQLPPTDDIAAAGSASDIDVTSMGCTPDQY